jgi:hypothetical protein
MFVITDERFLNSEMFQQDPRMPRVLGRDKIDLLQNVERAQCNIAQISDRRRDDVKHPRSSGESLLSAIGLSQQLDKAESETRNELMKGGIL